MPRYGLIQMRLHQGFSVHSTEPNVVEWAITQIRQAYPKYKFRDQHKYGFFAHDTTGYAEYNFRILAQLLQDGWKPFAADAGTLHLRKLYDD